MVVPFNKDMKRKLLLIIAAIAIVTVSGAAFYRSSADPEPDSLDSLDKLCAEYKIAIAIHPHGPAGKGRHRWWSAETIGSSSTRPMPVRASRRPGR